MPRRRRGRPSQLVLTRERILATTLDLLERDGLDGLTIRAVARTLRVDPMALYHYFPDKHALLAAAAAHAYAGLDPTAGTRGSWRQRLESLAIAYVEHLARAGELLRYLTARETAAREPARQLEARFVAASAELALPARDRRVAHDVFVDFLHGFSLGVRGVLAPAMRRRLRTELALICDSIAARSRARSRRARRERGVEITHVARRRDPP